MFSRRQSRQELTPEPMKSRENGYFNFGELKNLAVTQERHYEGVASYSPGLPRFAATLGARRGWNHQP